jgi:hypothetical protein
MDKDQAPKNSPRRKLNCWEVMMCGPEQGGSNAAEHGVCPAAADRSWEGINAGKCGGRDNITIAMAQG